MDSTRTLEMAKYEYVSQVRYIFESLGTIVVRSAVCAISFLGYSAPLVQFHPTNSPNSLPFETTSEVFCSAFNKSLSDTGTACTQQMYRHIKIWTGANIYIMLKNALVMILIELISLTPS